MRQLHQALRTLSAQFETERDPDRLCCDLADGLAHLAPELLACPKLSQEAASLYGRARSTLKALRKYRRLVALIDGMPCDGEVSELVREFLELAERLDGLPVREAMMQEFSQLARWARCPDAALSLPAELRAASSAS